MGGHHSYKNFTQTRVDRLHTISYNINKHNQKETTMTRTTPVNTQEAQQQLDAIALINTGVEQLAATLQAQGFDPNTTVTPIFDSYRELVNEIGQDLGNDSLRYSFQAGRYDIDTSTLNNIGYTIQKAKVA